MRGGAKADRHEVERLMARALEEFNRSANYELPTLFDLQSVIVIAGMVQVALRHPAVKKELVPIGEQFIESTIARLKQDGFPAHAELVEAGNDARFDS